MRRRRTTASRWAAVATGLLALVLLERTLGAETTVTRTLLGVVVLTAAAGAAKLWLHNCFESHLLVVVAALASLVGSVLSLTLGMPGGPVSPVTASHALIVGLSATIGVLLHADARARRASG